MQAVMLSAVYRVLDPVVAILHALRITPNIITGLSLVLSALSAYLLATGRVFESLFVISIAGLCDVTDGHLARTTKSGSAAGAFFDSFVDRISDGLLLIGIASLGIEKAPLLSLAALLSILAAFSVSYARARGESLGVDVRSGPMKRPARYLTQLILLVVFAFLQLQSEALAFQFLTAGMWVFLVLTIFTAGQRARLTMAALDSK